MKDSRKIRARALLGALVPVALLAGCTSASNGSTDAAPTKPAVASPTVEPAEVGEVLTEKPAVVADGAAAFAKTAGRYVVVSEDAPLPQSVVDDATAQLPAHLADKSSSFGAADDAASSYASQVEAGTGKTVVVIYPVIGRCTAGGDDMVAYTFTDFAGVAPRDFGCGLASSVEEAQARVAQGIAAQSNPEDFVVLAYAG